MPDALTVIAVAPPDPAAFLARWTPAFQSLNRDYEVLVVGPSGDPTDTVRYLPLDKPGVGASLRAALPEARHPLLFLVDGDARYRPEDLKPLLEKLETPGEIYGVSRTPDAASGYRAGAATPAFWTLLAAAYRVFCRVVLGAISDPSPGWLGFGNHARTWLAWAVMGEPLADPTSRFKLFRKSIFDKFPVQSDGDFALVEIFAKLTFVGSLLVEEPLTPVATPVPRADLRGWFAVLSNSKFTPQLPDVRKAPASATP